jgi:hypothetical protein
MQPDHTESGGPRSEREVVRGKGTSGTRSSPRRLQSPGRRGTDHDPRVTFGKKFLVVAVALINFVYLASEAFLSALHAC